MTLSTGLRCAFAALLVSVSGCSGPPREPGAATTSPLPRSAPPGAPVVTETPAEAPPPLRSGANTPFGARIGMDIASFQQRFPALPVTTPDSQVGVDAVVHGLDGRWTYTFKGGKLDWSLFDKYIDEITAPNFDRCLAAIDAIIADYTRQYGPPARLETGTRIFKDPYREHHWGYDVMRATWKAEGMKFQANFNFMGGKGVYHFLVKMEFQREDYAYF